MKPDWQYLAHWISAITGFGFRANTVGIISPQLRPVDDLKGNAFGIGVDPDWRRLRLTFELDQFAGDLLLEMGQADQTGRVAFRTILSNCAELGAEIEFRVNNETFAVTSEKVWEQRWNRMSLTLSKGQLEFDSGNEALDREIICQWTGYFAAAVVAILPLESDMEFYIEELQKYPEGATSTVQVNRYERDRRNRAAAISIHGTTCKACGFDFRSRYGVIAAGLIEVHHTTPVSKLGADYVVDPVRDLVPLCPNCHAVAHRQDPPLSVDEIGKLLCQSK